MKGNDSWLKGDLLSKKQQISRLRGDRSCSKVKIFYLEGDRFTLGLDNSSSKLKDSCSIAVASRLCPHAPVVLGKCCWEFQKLNGGLLYAVSEIEAICMRIRARHVKPRAEFVELLPALVEILKRSHITLLPKAV